MESLRRYAEFSELVTLRTRLLESARSCEASACASPDENARTPKRENNMARTCFTAGQRATWRGHMSASKTKLWCLYNEAARAVDRIR
jgi:hypothetical protein